MSQRSGNTEPASNRRLNVVTQTSQLSNISLFKVCLSGRFGVGKTSIFRCVAQRAGESRDTDIGEASIDHLRYNIPDFPSEISLYDTGGLEHTNDSLSFTNYYHNAHCIIFVYDITDMESLHYIGNEYNQLRENQQNECTRYVLFRNKTDEPSVRMSVTPEIERDFIMNRSDLANSIVYTIQTTARAPSSIEKFFFEDIQDVLKGQTPTGYKNKFKNYDEKDSVVCPCF